MLTLFTHRLLAGMIIGSRLLTRTTVDHRSLFSVLAVWQTMSGLQKVVPPFPCVQPYKGTKDYSWYKLKPEETLSEACCHKCKRKIVFDNTCDCCSYKHAVEAQGWYTSKPKSGRYWECNRCGGAPPTKKLLEKSNGSYVCCLAHRKTVAAFLGVELAESGEEPEEEEEEEEEAAGGASLTMCINCMVNPAVVCAGCASRTVATMMDMPPIPVQPPWHGKGYGAW